MLASRGSASWRSFSLLLLCSCAAACASESPSADALRQCLVDDPSDRSTMSCGTAESSYISAYEQEALSQCTHVPGRIHVSDEGTIVDAAQLSALRRVGSLTFFRNEAMTSGDGLEQLSVADTLGFNNLRALDDLGALSGLCEVTDELYVIGLPELTSLEGLHNVGSVGNLVLVGNAGLRDLDGLRGLQRVAGDVQIEGNTALPAAEIEAFVAALEVGGEITIADNG